MEELKALYERNRTFPNGGARLTEQKDTDGQWSVGDGHWRYGKFKSRKELRKVLRLCGFRSHKGAGSIYWHTY